MIFSSVWISIILKRSRKVIHMYKYYIIISFFIKDYIFITTYFFNFSIEQCVSFNPFYVTNENTF